MLKDDTITYNKKRIKKEFIDFFKKTLIYMGKDFPIEDQLRKIIKFRFSYDMAKRLEIEVTNKEINEMFFSMKNNKASRFDCFDVLFFKKVWNIVREDIIKAFFQSRHFLKKVKCIILTRVPKVSNPSICKDFRPITCCNTIYKCITKILTNYLKENLPLYRKT